VPRTGVSELAPAPPGSALGLPVLRAGAVERTRLAPFQAAAARSRLVLVSAPAGYGKSTLIAQWAERDPRPGCWAQLGDQDNNPAALLARVAGALDRIGPVDQKLLTELASRKPRVDETLLRLLVADMEGRDPFVLVLDDLHLVTAEKSQEVLEFLVDHFPSGSQLVLVARGDPGISLARLRAAGDLVEIEARLLALDAQETREVAASNGRELSGEEAEALCARSEGWAAAVILATLSSGRGDDGPPAIGLSGDRAEIAAYLVEEVLDRQAEHLRRFLLGTSILQRMTPPLCDAVLGTTDAAASLEALARAGAFIAPVDDQRVWYRYHPLFRELLRAELGRRDPELLADYSRRAADWYEQHGAPNEAFSYAHGSGDLVQAGRIALAHRDEFAIGGKSESVRLWLDRCSEGEIEANPQLSVAAAWASFYGGDAARARQFIAAAERGRLDKPSADGASSLRSSLASLRTLLAPDGIPQMLRDAELAYGAEKASGTRWYASGCRAMGMAYVLLGRPREAIMVLREALGLLRDHPELAHVRVGCLGYLVFAAAEVGDRRDVQRWAAEAILLVSEAHLEESAGAVAAYTAGALASQQRGDYEEAARRLECVRRSRRHLGAALWADADLALRCADISLELGDHDGAIDFEQIASDASQAYPDAGTLPTRLRDLEGRIKRGEDFGLTSAELRVLGFLPTHLSLQEIGGRLFLARPTVKTHVASIYDKLGASGRSEAVEMIEHHGLGAVGFGGQDPDHPDPASS
jgi:LuxR family transcriptional regulator, maltose regulon positive regulatory protein